MSYGRDTNPFRLATSTIHKDAIRDKTFVSHPVGSAHDGSLRTHYQLRAQTKGKKT
jgi:hypothetical protein